MAASPVTDSTRAPRSIRASHAWALALTGIATVAIIVALALVGGGTEQVATSRAITDIELSDDDATISTVVRPRFRPVLRRVVPVPAAASPVSTAGRAATPRPSGGTTVRPPTRGGSGGGGATPTPTTPTPVAPAPAVPVVSLPPTAVGPVGGLPAVAVGPGNGNGHVHVTASSSGISGTAGSDGISVTAGSVSVTVG